MKCFACQGFPGNSKIKKFDNWTIYLHHNQVYLGWCLISINSHVVDPIDAGIDKWNELFSILSSLKKAMNILFQPDLFNYSMLGNSISHAHMHFVPRYKEPRIISNIKFSDNRWGHHYKPYDKEFSLPQNVLSELAMRIKEQL